MLICKNKKREDRGKREGESEIRREREREKERESEREYKGKILVRESILANHTYCFVIQYPC